MRRHSIRLQANVAMRDICSRCLFLEYQPASADTLATLSIPACHYSLHTSAPTSSWLRPAHLQISVPILASEFCARELSPPVFSFCSLFPSGEGLLGLMRRDCPWAIDKLHAAKAPGVRIIACRFIVLKSDGRMRGLLFHFLARIQQLHAGERWAKRPRAALAATPPASAEPRNWLHFCSLCFLRVLDKSRTQIRRHALPCPVHPTAFAACLRKSAALALSRNNDGAQMSQECPPCISRP